MKTLLLALAALTTTTTLAAPAPSSVSPLSPLTKRADYHSSSVPQEDDYCGEAVPQWSYGPGTPKASDCVALYEANPGPGYWLVTAAETEAREAAGADRWTRLAASGTCAFEVRLSHDNDHDGTSAVDYRFGTNDVRFYIRAHASEDSAKDGRVSVTSGVWCRRGDVQGMVTVDFRVVLA